LFNWLEFSFNRLLHHKILNKHFVSSTAHVSYTFNMCNNTLTSLSSNNTFLFNRHSDAQYHSLIHIWGLINFENDFLLKRWLCASRSFSLGSISHSFVFEGRNMMSLLYSLHQFFYFKLASQRWRKYIRSVHEVILN
jgi:hypothetical protein